MSKLFLVLSLLIQILSVQSVWASEYRSPDAGFKVKLPQQEVNIVGKDFYGGLQPNGNFIYVYSLDAKQAAKILEQPFSDDTFNADYEAVALLERSGIDPKKADLKVLNPQLFWPADKPFIDPLPKDAVISISTQKIHNKKSLSMQFTETKTAASATNSKKAGNDDNSSKVNDLYLCSIDLLAANNKLYVISTKTLLAPQTVIAQANNKQSDVANKTAAAVNNVNTRDVYLQGVRLIQPQLNNIPLVYNDKIGKFKLQIPDDWYYVQSYFSSDPKACLTFALPLDTLQKIKEKTHNLQAGDLEKDKISDNTSEASVASWMELMTEAAWSVSCETKGVETAAYLADPTATKNELQLLFSELKTYVESSRYYKNANFTFNVDITPKIGYINFDLAFNLKDKKNFKNTGRVFFTKKKGGVIVYTSALNDDDQNTSKVPELLDSIKKLELK